MLQHLTVQTVCLFNSLSMCSMQTGLSCSCTHRSPRDICEGADIKGCQPAGEADHRNGAGSQSATWHKGLRSHCGGEGCSTDNRAGFGQPLQPNGTLHGRLA